MISTRHFCYARTSAYEYEYLHSGGFKPARSTGFVSRDKVHPLPVLHRERLQHDHATLVPPSNSDMPRYPAGGGTARVAGADA